MTSVRVVVTGIDAVLRLEDGSETELSPGDCVVQRGTSHAWGNASGERCIVSGVMIALGA